MFVLTEKTSSVGVLACVLLASFALGSGCKSNAAATTEPGASASATPSASASAAAVLAPVSPNQPGEWLHTERNKILMSDGKPFHGRGANLQDTRSCDACSWEPPHPEEVMRRSDMLVNDWKANFVRLTLESYAPNPPGGPQRAHSKNALEDEAYLKDVEKIVHHIEKTPGTYVLMTVWHDPTITKDGWPTDDTRKLWQKMVPRFASDPRVMFGVVTEPERNEDGEKDPQVWDAMNRTVDAIRTAEGTGMHHIVVVQGTGGWSRRLTYYVTHPITALGGIDVAYEIHVYDPKPTIDALFDGPAKTLPVIVGELGPIEDAKLAKMSPDDCAYLMTRAEAVDMPYLAWTFHMRCPPNLLVDNSNKGCGDGMKLEPTPWGQQLKDQLAKPYAAK